VGWQDQKMDSLRKNTETFFFFFEFIFWAYELTRPKQLDSCVKRIQFLKLPKWSRVISKKMMNKVTRKNTHKNKKTAITTTKTNKNVKLWAKGQARRPWTHLKLNLFATQF
jgi:hypothetical protein